MKITIYTANGRGDEKNVLYPHEINIDTKQKLDASIFENDYVSALYKGNYRSNDNFIKTNCIMADIDNDHSEEESEWFTAEDVKSALRGVPFIIHYSRNHMKDKQVTKANGTLEIRQKRPKFHLIIATNEITSKEDFDVLLTRFASLFPFIDKKAKDAAHFFFGTEHPKAELFDGYMPLNELLDEMEFDNAVENKEIPEGERNATMYLYATKVLKRYGDSENARILYDEKATSCNPLLEDNELETIWKSAVRFYQKVVVVDPSYKNPDEYIDTNSYAPTDYSDVAQARLIDKYFANELKYSAATLNIVYRNNKWEESESGAQAIAQELTERQLREAERLIIEYFQKCKVLGVFGIVANSKKKEIDGSLNDKQKEAYYGYLDAKKYKEYVIKRRASHAISASLKEVRPMVEIDSTMLDANPFLLNTPGGTYDLRKGVKGLREHRAEDLITKMTTVAPSLKGKGVWDKFLHTVFGGNQNLIDYVQEMCGITLIGKVYVEAFIIAYGDGGNGKSTFFNSISHVIGDYHGSIASDVLTTGIKRDKQADLAELRGKRLVIAAETKVGDSLDESTIKRMCSTDKINACKKYKDPFDFVPSHTLVVYTNNLPKVNTIDDGTWRRIIVIPFKHKFTGTEDIKNYAEVLVEEAGEYILYWLIEGAKKAIDNKFHIEPPAEVIDAIKGYKEQSDTITMFLQEKCDTSDKKAECPSGELYAKYRAYCYEMGEKARSTTDFNVVLSKNGFIKVKKNSRFYIKGISILPIDLSSAAEDFEELLK